MSSLKPLTTTTICKNSVWFFLFNKNSIDDKLNSLVTHTKMDIWGTRLQNQNYSFSDLIEHLSSETQQLARVIYGLFISCSTGEIHPLLQSNLIQPWVARVFCFRIHGEPAFSLICQRQMHTVATWMVNWLVECPERQSVINSCLDDGDSPLHMAIRNRHWDWASWLIASGCQKHSKNKAGESPLLLMAPHEEHVHLLREKTTEWYDNLHEALGINSSWTQRLIDEGADINQSNLYSEPVDILLVLAKNGMDMNLSPLPLNLSPFHYRILYSYGRIPDEWNSVLNAFDDIEFVKALFQFFERGCTQMLTEEYKTNVLSRRAVTPETKSYAKRIQNEI